MIKLILISLILTFNSISTSTVTTKPYTQSLQIYHRLLSSANSIDESIPIPKWEKKALIRVDLNTNSVWLDLDSMSNVDTVGIESLEGDEGLYQIGAISLEENETSTNDESKEITDSDMNSMVQFDSCSIRQKHSIPFEENFIFNFLPFPANDFLNFFYSTNAEIYCKGKLQFGSSQVVTRRGSKGFRGGDSGRSIEVKISRGEPPKVKYDTVKPVVLGADGKVVVPPKEKGFVQKYWIYGVVIFAVFMFTGSDEEPPAGEGDGAASTK